MGLLGSVVIMGPALGSGSLLNLDLVLVPDPPVPHGMWGLGAELPRRVPLWGPIAWLSHLTDGTVVGKAVMVAALTSAFRGTWGYVRNSITSPWAAAALFAFGPFLITRATVGHWQVLGVMALLPWALPSLLAPRDHQPRALLWAAALGLNGVYGALIAGTYLAAGLIISGTLHDRAWREAGALLVKFVVTQLPWLASLVVVGWSTSGASLADASDFAPQLTSAGDVGRLLAGHGFWNSAFQVGADQPMVGAIAGYLLFGLAVVGFRDLPSHHRTALTAIAGICLLLAASSALPIVGTLVDAVSASSLGAPLRDTQRFLPPYLLWLVLSAALGARRVARLRAERALVRAALGALAVVPVGAAIVLAAPAVWGVGGSLRPVDLPREWRDARTAIVRAPGPVVSLPWFQYFTLDVARGRLTLGVLPYYLGGDVITASDPRLSAVARQEVPDPREPVVADILRDAQRGEHPSAALATAGVRWVALQHDVDWRTHTGLFDDPGLQRVVAGPNLDLYLVKAWQGPVASQGGVVKSNSLIGPFMAVESSDRATLARGYQRGWMRGLASAETTAAGLVGLPAGSGIVWFWPSLLVLACDVAAIVVVIHEAQRLGHGTRPGRARVRGPGALVRRHM